MFLPEDKLKLGIVAGIGVLLGVLFAKHTAKPCPACPACNCGGVVGAQGSPRLTGLGECGCKQGMGLFSGQLMASAGGGAFSPSPFSISQSKPVSGRLRRP